MAADVTYLVRALNRYKEDQHHRTVAGKESGRDESTALITRDLLGKSFELPDSQELDLDLQVPNGCEKRLDLKSGKVYIQRCNSPNSSDHNKYQINQTVTKLQDLNFPPTPSRFSLNLFDESSLDLKLVSASSSASSSSTNYQSVCTLDKVKSALERAEKEPMRKRSSMWKSSSSPTYSSSSSSIKENQEDEGEEKLSLSPIAAGCPSCLLYVLISRNNPKCPRCNSVVPLPLMKKPRIDLNMTI